MNLLNKMPWMSGRLMKEDKTQVNIADTLYDDCVTAMEYNHREVHMGNMWTGTKVITGLPNAGASYYFTIKTGAKEAHITLIEFDTVGVWRWNSYASPTISNLGSEVVYSNRKLNTSQTRTAAIYHGSTVTNAGTLRMEKQFGYGDNPSKASPVTTVNSGIETVVPPNTELLIQLINNSGGTQTVTTTVEWYEE